ncbi:MAG: hypothetical protein OEY86_20150 [Nitrospira sp.]|nr:hypothetical protein [Nitrospira sp.]
MTDEQIFREKYGVSGNWKDPLEPEEEKLNLWTLLWYTCNIVAWLLAGLWVAEQF